MTRPAILQRVAGVVFALALAGCAAAAPPPAGALVIVGGALADDNAEIYNAFIERADAAGRDAPIAVIAGASSAPAESADRFAAALSRHGVDAARIVTVRLALADDPSTADIDESLWATNANAASEIALIERAGAIWFAGGDQSRLTKLLLDADGADTPLLAAIRARLEQGAVIGGTSAGAAIMSRLMIAGGDSFGAMVAKPIQVVIGESPPETGAGLYLAPGLGFLAQGVADQHFDQRGRLGRLAIAATHDPAGFGLGVDENTALIVDLRTERATVAGAGSVTLIDGRRAMIAREAPFAAGGFVISVASAGDMIDLRSLTVAPAPFRKPTVGAEYAAAPLASGGGPAVPYPGLANFLGEGLLDNSAAHALEAISFLTDGRGVRFTFQQSDASAGYWGRDGDGSAGYTIQNVRFDIAPVSVAITESVVD